MKRHAVTVFTAVATIMLSGCSLAGTWKAVKTDPADAVEHFPILMVTFNADGEYSASEQHGSDVKTSLGTYKWDGLKLTIMPNDGAKRVYSGNKNLFTRQLVLSHQVKDQKVTAWLEKQEGVPQ
ncbi:MAG: hypothetical protein ACYSUI_15120 [Planctomycetota bacterium]|jgi:hypothetical protein